MPKPENAAPAVNAEVRPEPPASSGAGTRLDEALNAWLVELYGSPVLSNPDAYNYLRLTALPALKDRLAALCL